MLTFVATLTDGTYILATTINKPTVWVHVGFASIATNRTPRAMVNYLKIVLQKK